MGGRRGGRRRGVDLDAWLWGEREPDFEGELAEGVTAKEVMLQILRTHAVDEETLEEMIATKVLVNTARLVESNRRVHIASCCRH